MFIMKINTKIYIITLFFIINIFVFSMLNFKDLFIKKKELISAEIIEEGKPKRWLYSSKNCSPLDYYLTSNKCKDLKKHNILIIGDSHEVDGYNLLQTAFNKNKDVNLINFGTINQCDFHGSKNSELNCEERIKFLNKMFEDKILTDIFLSFNQPFAPNSILFYQYISNQLKKNSKKMRVFILGGFINNVEPCPVLINTSKNVNACHDPKNISWLPVNETKDLLFKYIYIDKFKAICPNLNNNCKTHLILKDSIIPYSYDKHHHSLEYSQYLGHLMKNEINKYFQ